MATTLETIQDVMREVFDDEELLVNPETTAHDVDGWDSLSHVTLILKVEQALGVRFRLSDVAELKNIGELVVLAEREQAR